jgi:hypothetical protein
MGTGAQPHGAKILAFGSDAPVLQRRPGFTSPAGRQFEICADRADINSRAATFPQRTILARRMLRVREAQSY